MNPIKEIFIAVKNRRLKEKEKESDAHPKPSYPSSCRKPTRTGKTPYPDGLSLYAMKIRQNL
ncbi:hypothetical protein HQ39_05565 [Porphyromonas sp. COT-108 OH2963]|uniref:Transposase n=1 Tax=Porphyromonas canoris TaxID=36875 RepID=A0ABR4XJ44_9PORP|nr:hypothetical protein HQ43_06370 [Porphyromonas canoris]KGN95698.1 hypothetical protein HQ39_05565 [Porphyromonas sp. COT-108 OH2963]